MEKARYTCQRKANRFGHEGVCGSFVLESDRVTHEQYHDDMDAGRPSRFADPECDKWVQETHGWE